MPKITEHDKQQVAQQVRMLFCQAETALNTFFEKPAITWRKSGKHAGTAYLTQNKINFNRVLFLHNRPAYFSDVIPHETSHIIVYQHFGRVKPHGKEWKFVMEDIFKVPANTTHNFDLTPLNLNTFRYRCGCKEIELGIRRHNNVLKNKQSYRCKVCGETLQPLAEGN